MAEHCAHSDFVGLGIFALWSKNVLVVVLCLLVICRLWSKCVLIVVLCCARECGLWSKIVLTLMFLERVILVGGRKLCSSIDVSNTLWLQMLSQTVKKDRCRFSDGCSNKTIFELLLAGGETQRIHPKGTGWR